MKTFTKALVIVTMFFMVSYTTPAPVQAQGVAVSYQVFYDQLSPYGSWVNYGSYGYVWIPYTEPGFSPYSTNGYWAWTDYGWTWVSYYPWGWGPFHYGRWDFDPFYGWFWVPGYEWGPAWVCWRHAPGYYGWAPIAPGISMTIVIAGRWHPHHDRWLFMHEGYMGDHYIDRYYVPRADNDRIIRRSSFIRDTYNDRDRGVTYVSGPRRTDVEKRTGKPVQRVEIVDRTAPGHSVENNRMDIYRPRVEKRDDTKPAPKKVEDLKNVPGVKTREENYRKNPSQNREQQQQQEQKRTEPQNQPEQKNEPRQQREEPQRKPDGQPQQQPQKRPDEVQPNPQREQPQRKPDVQPQQQQREQPQRKPDIQPQQQQRRPDEVQPNPQREQPQRKPDVQPQQPQREQPQRKPDVQPQQPQREQPQRKPDVQPQQPQREQPQRKPDVQPQRQLPQQQQQRQQPQRQPQPQRQQPQPQRQQPQQQRQQPQQQRRDNTRIMPRQSQQKVNPKPENKQERGRSKAD